MRLIRIMCANLLETFNFDHELTSPVVVITGGNEAGKSTLLRAATLAIEGPTGSTFPVVGTSPRYDWSARVAFAEPATEINRWMRDEHHGATWNGYGGKLRDVQAQIEDRVGAAAVWSVEDFLALGSSKQLAWLESNVLTGVGWTVDHALERVRGGWEPGTAERLFGDPLQLTTDTDGRALLSRLIAAAKKHHGDADADAKRLTKAVEQDERDVAKAPPRPAGTAAGCRARAGDLERQLAEAQRAAGVAEEASRTYTAAQERLNQLQAALTAEQGTHWAARGAAAEEAIAAPRAALAAHRLIDSAGTVARRTAELAVAAQEARDAEDLLKAARERAGAAAAVSPYRERLIRALGAAESAARDLEATAPVTAAVLLEDVKALERALLYGDTTEIDRYQTEATTAATLRDALARRLERAKEEHGAWLERGRVLEHEVNDAQAALARARADRDGSEERARALLDEIDAARAQLEACASADVSALEAQIAGLKAERAEALRAADLHTDADGLKATRDERRIARDAAIEKRTTYLRAGQRLEGLMADMLADTVQPLMADMERITVPVLGARVRCVISGGFDLYLERTGPFGKPTRAPLETVSRSARAVTLIALRYAIASRLGGWRSLILDDFENLERDRRDRLLSVLLEETRAGRLDTFLAACVADDWTPPAGVQHIALPSRALAHAE